MKAEYFSVTEATNHAVTMRTAKGMSGIVKKFETASRRDLPQRFNVTWTAENVNRQDACGPWSDQLFDQRRIDVVCVSINVTEDRRNPLPLERMSSRNESERGHDYFAGEIQCSNRNLKSDCGIAHRHAVFHADDFRY